MTEHAPHKRNWSEVGIIVAVLAGVQAMGWALPWNTAADIAVMKATITSVDARLARLEDVLLERNQLVGQAPTQVTPNNR